MQGDIKAKITGLYHVTLTDSVTGEIKYNNTFHNILTTHGLRSLTPYKLVDGGDEVTNGLYVGTGTAVPEFSDTGAKSLLWTTSAVSVVREYLNNGYTQKTTKSFRFPATSSYVSDAISEAGLYYNTAFSYTGGVRRTYMWLTRCLFTDSEGHVITITKTDLDILDIVVELEITMTSSNSSIFKLYPKQNQLNTIMVGLDSYSREYGTLGLFKFDEDVNGVYPYLRSGSGTLQNPFGSYTMNMPALGGSINNENKIATITSATVRIPNTVLTDEVYFRGLGFGTYGIFMLPNASFNPYTISNIPIGTGDGETTEFTNPLSYFMKDTEVIKIDDVALTRGTDYTINNMGNVNKKFEVCQNIKPVTAISGILYNDPVFGDYTSEVSSMFKPTTVSRKAISQFDTSTECFGINSSNSAILDFGEAKTFNFIKGYNIKLLRKQISNNAYSIVNPTATVYVDASNDGEHWTNVCETTIASNSIAADFDNAATAQYWRIRTSQVDTDNIYDFAIIIQSTNYTSDCGIALGYCDPIITFNTAPADGSIITMDVNMDIIMKNGNFAIDLAPAISLQVTS